jgi:anti-sigma B factor antagonist
MPEWDGLKPAGRLTVASVTTVWDTRTMDDMVGTSVEVVDTDDGWALSGEIDASSAPGVAAAMAVVPPSSASSGRVVVNASDVTFIDSSGLRVLIDLSERAAAVGAKLVISSPSRSVARVLQLTGLDDVFEVELAAD